MMPTLWLTIWIVVYCAITEAYCVITNAYCVITNAYCVVTDAYCLITNASFIVCVIDNMYTSCDHWCLLLHDQQCLLCDWQYVYCVISHWSLMPTVWLTVCILYSGITDAHCVIASVYCILCDHYWIPLPFSFISHSGCEIHRMNLWWIIW